MEKIKLIETFAKVFFVAYLSTNDVLPNEETVIEAAQEAKPTDIEEISTRLYQREGVFEQIGRKLEENGYLFQTLIEVHDKDDIEVKYILENKIASKTVQKEVSSIFFDWVEQHNLESSTFTLSVEDYYDGPDW